MAVNVYCIRCCKWMNQCQSGWECRFCQAFLSANLVGDHDHSRFHVSIERDELLTPEWEEVLSGCL